VGTRYAAAGRADQFEAHTFPGGHRWDGAGLDEFLMRNL
jgi:hypothetical protein